MQNRFSRGLLFLALLFCAHHVFALVAPDVRAPHSPEQRIAALEQQEHEVQGLDVSQHGEEGYYWEVST